jgi:uncharacterized membrane protein
MMKRLQSNLLVRMYLARTEGERIVFLCSSFSIGLAVFRIAYTGKYLFAFLAWNLFLAYVPYAISRRVAANIPQMKILPLVMALFAWLLFIPNAFYIITDLFHLGMDDGVPLWYDLALLLSFAWSGLLFGILSVRQMESLFENYVSKKAGLFFIYPVMLLNAFGVYVGRYLRFNSWDVVANPLQLANDIIYLFIHPIRNRFDWSMIVCYSLLMTLIYFAIKKLGRALS